MKDKVQSTEIVNFIGLNTKIGTNTAKSKKQSICTVHHEIKKRTDKHILIQIKQQQRLLKLK